MIKTFCPLPQPLFQPLSPSNQAELSMGHSWLLLPHPHLALGFRESSSGQEQALGTRISCLLDLRYEKGRVATGWLLLATLSTANTAGLAKLEQLQIHLWPRCSASSLPPHAPDERFIKAKPRGITLLSI